MATSREKKIAKLEADINKLEIELAELEAADPDIWNPKRGSFVINNYGELYTVPYEGQIELSYYGSEFVSKDIAITGIKAFRDYHRLYHLQQELDSSWMPDWDDRDENFKITLKNGKYSDELESSDMNIGVIYFQSKTTVRAAIDLIEAGEVFI